MFKRKLADIESKEDQLGDSLEQTEKMRASPSILKQAKKQREQMQNMKNKLQKNLQTASMLTDEQLLQLYLKTS